MDTFISLSCLTPLAKTFNTMLNSSGGRGQAVSPSSQIMMVVVDFSLGALCHISL